MAPNQISQQGTGGLELCNQKITSSVHWKVCATCSIYCVEEDVSVKSLLRKKFFSLNVFCTAVGKVAAISEIQNFREICPSGDTPKSYSHTFESHFLLRDILKKSANQVVSSIINMEVVNYAAITLLPLKQVHLYSLKFENGQRKGPLELPIWSLNYCLSSLVFISGALKLL